MRRFGAFTGELDKLVEWLQKCGVRTVAMESTGVYWIPLAQKLEAAGIETVLANARHLRQVPGRKTDVKGKKALGSRLGHVLSFDSAEKVPCGGW